MTPAVLTYQLIIMGVILFSFWHGKGWGYFVGILALIWTFTQVWFMSPVMFIQLATIGLGTLIGHFIAAVREYVRTERKEDA